MRCCFRYQISFAVLLLFLTVSATSESTNREPITDEQIEAFLTDRRYLTRQLKCALGEAPCDPVGRKLKNIVPLVLRGSCPNCSKEETRQIQKVLVFVQKKYPTEFQRLLQKYSG